MGFNALLRHAGLETNGYDLEIYESGRLIQRSQRSLSRFMTPASTAKFPLGTIARAGDRTFVYGLAGSAADLAAGKLCQSAVNGGGMSAEWKEATVADADQYATSLTVTVPADGDVTANQLKDGYLVVSGGAAASLGHCYKIKSNTAAAAAASCTITLYDKLKVALSSTPKVSVVANPYRAAVVTPQTTLTGLIVGVPIVKITKSYYGWFLTWGMGPGLANGDITADGKPLVSPSAVAGAIKVMPATAEDDVVVAESIMSIDDTKYGPVYWKIFR